MRRGFLGPRPIAPPAALAAPAAPAAPATPAAPVPVHPPPAIPPALPFGDHARTHAACIIQAHFRGELSRRRDLYRALLTPVSPGHKFIRSPLNLARYLDWLGQEHRSGDNNRVSAARACWFCLPLTEHVSDPDECFTSPGSVFGPLPTVECTQRPCRRCDGPFARGGYHFRHLGPWSVGNPPVNAAPANLGY